MTADALRVDRLRLDLRLATAHERARLLEHRLRAAVARGIDAALARQAQGGPGTRLVFIDRLDFECSVNAGWDDDLIVDRVARQVWQALAQAQRGDVAAGVRSFADAGEYLAAFIAALAEGSAWRAWWFARFDGLRALPVAAALRTALLDDVDVGLHSLLRLTPASTHQVLAALGPLEVERVLGAWCATRGNGRAPPVTLLLAHVPTAEPAAELAALLALERARPGSASAAALAALRCLRELEQAVRRGALRPEPDDHAEPEAALARYLRALALPFTFTADAAVAAALVAHLSGLPRPADGAGAAIAESADLATAHGGAVVLAALLLRLGWWERWHRALPERTGAAYALNVVALALSDKPGVRAQLDADPALRRVFGLTDDDEPARLRALGRRAFARACRPAPALEAAPPALQLGQGRRALRAWLDGERGCSGLLRGSLPNGADTAAADPVTLAWWRQHHAQQRGGDGLVRLTALGLLREFAARVPGCGNASADYLRSRLLCLPARVRSQPPARGVEVALGHAPLDVLLVVAGMKRWRLPLPDGGELRVGERLGGQLP